MSASIFYFTAGGKTHDNTTGNETMGYSISVATAKQIHRKRGA